MNVGIMRLLVYPIGVILTISPAFASEGVSLVPPVQLRPAPVQNATTGKWQARGEAFKHRLWQSTFIVRHPLEGSYRATYPVRHPLKTGKWMEQSGFNGLLSGMGAAGCIASPFVTGFLVSR